METRPVQDDREVLDYSSPAIANDATERQQKIECLLQLRQLQHQYPKLLERVPLFSIKTNLYEMLRELGIAKQQVDQFTVQRTAGNVVKMMEICGRLPVNSRHHDGPRRFSGQLTLPISHTERSRI